MGALRKLRGTEDMKWLARLSVNRDFVLFRELLNDSLMELRESSDHTLSWERELISKGQRQALSEILALTDREKCESLSDKFRQTEGAEAVPFVE